MTVDELVALITSPSGEIYPFSYSANTMAAYGVNQKLVDYFHKAASDVNRHSYDRTMIFAAFDKADRQAAAAARHASFLRLNPHIQVETSHAE